MKSDDVHNHQNPILQQFKYPGRIIIYITIYFKFPKYSGPSIQTEPAR